VPGPERAALLFSAGRLSAESFCPARVSRILAVGASGFATVKSSTTSGLVPSATVLSMDNGFSFFIVDDYATFCRRLHNAKFSGNLPCDLRRFALRAVFAHCVNPFDIELMPEPPALPLGVAPRVALPFFDAFLAPGPFFYNGSYLLDPRDLHSFPTRRSSDLVIPVA